LLHSPDLENDMWTKQRTRQGDTLTTLARAYGTSVNDILAANDVCPPSQHSDRYLSQQASAFMLPSNLPRASLSKLVLERDIQKWVRSIGGDCEDIREGSMTQNARLLTCPPGHYCCFSSDVSINLPLKKRIVSLSGLGATSSADLAFQVSDLRGRAKTQADRVVDSLTFDGDAKAWRTTFLAQVDTLVTAAMGKDANGKFNFERNPALVTKIATFIVQETKTAQKELGFAAALTQQFDDIASTARSIANAVDSALVVSDAPPTTTTAASATALASVRTGKATLKKGQKGAAVSALQSLLSQKLPKAKIPAGFTVDGDFGAKTESAVKNFQTRASLAVNGTVDQSTLRALEAGVSVNTALPATASGRSTGPVFASTATTLAMIREGGSTLSKGQSGAGVREAQALFNTKGIKGKDGKALTVDSLFGDQTEAAVKAAQTRASLPVTGTLDSATLQAIESDFAAALPAIQTQSLGKSNTMLYVGGAAVALLIVAAVAKKRGKRAA
jgi:peptidoglycan hydrolase-like protein with peptidoglycan-binding domain